ncbi:3'(2'),5'-bisphosphate nucleotidase CysQ [Crenalkalicoccus roseus]|uniref:3'(2'),5'-bisphosphate nucleotidase CysQ n=1 Tax=Crenalkalicoccus roseus TaxID=1485588 RepID=UPI001080DEF2|nr:3'(2'),5'-bisphosphate nucleotidase CysQ [Crenalkalicoccus roseus]
MQETVADPALRSLAGLALAAGAAILRIYAAPAEATRKADGSPLTAADLAAEAVIAEGLARHFPDLPVLSEEAAPAAAGLGAAGEAFLLVDPLDGTREFLGRNGEFTVNIALIREGRPRLGVVHAPALGRLWLGRAGAGAEVVEVAPGGSLAGAPRRPIRVRPRPAAGLVAVASRSHLDAETERFLATLPVTERRSIGSSLKFCLIAEGEADVYPRFGPTMEWDTAAGQAVLEAAGGRVTTPEGAPLGYGKAAAGYRNGPFIAWGG